jgi:hypothetical protein
LLALHCRRAVVGQLLACEDRRMAASRRLAFRVPADSRIPDPSSGTATPHDYDRFFELERQPVDLLDWTSDCLSLERRLLGDLGAAQLSDRDQKQILAGLVIVYRSTLERWTHAARGS